MFEFVYAEFFGSFLWQILWLFFWNFYGVRQLFWARDYVGDVLSFPESYRREEAELGFGQLLALLLLTLSVLAALEAYQGQSLQMRHDSVQQSLINNRL